MVEQWGVDITVSSVNTIVPFYIQYTQSPMLQVTHHYNNAGAVTFDSLGYFLDTTGFKTNYASGNNKVSFYVCGY